MAAILDTILDSNIKVVMVLTINTAAVVKGSGCLYKYACTFVYCEHCKAVTEVVVHPALAMLLFKFTSAAKMHFF